ncbi:MAG: 30S ribosomal protein S3ae [Candidatus Helarchaeota archaeon]
MSPKGKRRGRRKTQAVDKWRAKEWYNVITPVDFGNVEIAQIPTSNDVVGRTVETTLYDITNDYSQTHIKLFFKIKEVEGSTAHTKFWGQDLTRDYIRSLVRRTTSQIKGIFNVLVKADASDTARFYKIRVTIVVFTQKRAKTSQQKAIRAIMKKVIERKAQELPYKDFIRECVFGKIGSAVYNEAKIIYPLRKSEVMKLKIIAEPSEVAAA